MKNINKPSSELKEILFLSIERILMSKVHLECINNFILRRDRKDLQTPNYNKCLKIILSGIVINTHDNVYGLNEKEKKCALDKLYELFSAIKEFQNNFSILPKEDAPIELHRFLRIFHREGLPKSDDINPSSTEYVIYLGEQQCASTYASSPLADFENTYL